MAFDVLPYIRTALRWLKLPELAIAISVGTALVLVSAAAFPAAFEEAGNVLGHSVRNLTFYAVAYLFALAFRALSTALAARRRRVKRAQLRVQSDKKTKRMPPPSSKSPSADTSNSTNTSVACCGCSSTAATTG